MNEPSRCAQRAPRHIWLVCLLACLLLSTAGAARPVAAQSLIEGVDGWSDAVTGRAMTKWGGQRVDFPTGQPAPPGLGYVAGLVSPFRVHAVSARAATRLTAVLRHAEQASDMLRASGLFALPGDGGQGGTLARDLYLGPFERSGAVVSEHEPASELDSVRSFVLIDERIPGDRLAACTSQALIEAELLELDPAEAESVRTGSAAYFTRLLLGESCDERELGAARDTLHEPLAFADWLAALGARQDQNRGAFVQNMWHFARQRTWEGSGLRGSPDLLEVIGKALELSDESLEQVAGLVTNQGALLRARARGLLLPEVPRVAWRALPSHQPPIAPALLPLDSAFLLVDLEDVRAGQRLSIWSRGESGVRWVLSATRLDGAGNGLGTLNAPVRKTPEAELLVELDAQTRFVLVSVSNLAGGLPDPDRAGAAWARSVRLIVDRSN